MICVYAIKNKSNGKMYVGSALDYNSRVRLHKSQLNRNVHHSVTLQRAFNKYGADSFEFFVLEEVLKKDLLIREQFYINFYQSFNKLLGYNIAPIAGSSLGIKRSSENTRKNRERQIGLKQSKSLIEKRRIGLLKAYKDRGDSINRKRIRSINKRVESQPFCNYEWLNQEYLVNQKSIITIGNSIGKHPTTIRKWLTRFNIPVRSLIERNVLIGQKIKQLRSEQCHK